MKRVLTAVVLIPLVVLAVLRAPAWFLALLVGAVALLASREYLNIVEGHGLKTFRRWIYAFIALIFAAAAYGATASPFLHPFALDAFRSIFLVGSLLLLALGMRQGDLRQVLPAVAASCFSMLYVTWPLLLLVERIMPSDFVTSDGRRDILFLLVVVWVSDTFAYVGGTLFGRRSLAPRVSPKKTWEGAIASILGAVLVGSSAWFLENKYRPGLNNAALWYWITFAVVLNVASQFGDLVESMMKRGAGMKDSGSILPGHGGMLDRIDALLFASVAMWYYPFFFNWIRNLTQNP